MGNLRKEYWSGFLKMQVIKKSVSKWQSMSDVAKASIAFVISSFLLKGISFITTPIFTRLIDTNEYGIVAEYNSWQTILEVFALLGLTSAGVFNVGLNDYKEKRSQYMSSTLTICNLATCIVLAIILLFKLPFGSDFILPTNLIIIMFLNFIFHPAQIFWITRQRYEYKYKLAVLLTILSTLLTQGVSILCVIVAKTQHLAEVKIWSGVLAGFIICVPLYFYVLVNGKAYYDKQMWKQILKFAIPLLPHYLAQHIMSGADRIMLANMISKSDAGIYAVVLNISVIASIIWNSINASIVPYTFEHMNDKDYKSINKMVLPIVGGFACVCVMVTIAAPEIMAFLAPEDYHSGIYAVPPVVSTAFLSALYNIYANIEFYHKKSSFIAGATVVSAAVNIGLNALLIPLFGFVGAAYTTLASSIVLILVHYWGYRKAQKDRVYNDKLVFLIALVCIVACEAMNLLYINIIIRYIVLGAMFVIVIAYRKRIMAIVRMIKKKRI